MYEIKKVTISRNIEGQVNQYSYLTSMFTADIEQQRKAMKAQFQADSVIFIFTEVKDFNPEILPK